MRQGKRILSQVNAPRQDACRSARRSLHRRDKRVRSDAPARGRARCAPRHPSHSMVGRIPLPSGRRSSVRYQPDSGGSSSNSRERCGTRTRSQPSVGGSPSGPSANHLPCGSLEAFSSRRTLPTAPADNSVAVLPAVHSLPLAVGLLPHSASRLQPDKSLQQHPRVECGKP